MEGSGAWEPSAEMPNAALDNSPGNSALLQKLPMGLVQQNGP